MFKRGSKWSAGAIIILVLTAIGIIVVLQNPLQILLPIIVLGGIFLLYKYPPSFLSGQRSGNKRTPVIRTRNRNDASAKAKRDRPRSKTMPFRVIEGGKDNDDTPKYH